MASGMSVFPARHILLLATIFLQSVKEAMRTTRIQLAEVGFEISLEPQKVLYGINVINQELLIEHSSELKPKNHV